MQFSNFTRTEDGNKIFFINDNPLQGVRTIKYYKDNSSGSFSKKEFRWSFNKDYWSSWETLNQGNLSSIDLTGNTLLFLELRYTSNGSGEVTTFTLHYNGAAQSSTAEKDCPPDSNYVPVDKSIQEGTYDPAGNCYTESSKPVDADTLCGKPCDYYLWRPNHKGEQPIATITDLQKILNNLSGGIQNSITNGANVSGNGIGVFYEKTAQTLFFKRIDVGEGMDISETDGVISIGLDSSLVVKDPSINQLFDLYYSLEQDLYDLSIYVDSQFLAVDASINQLFDITIQDIINVGGGPGEIFKIINNNTAELRTIVSGSSGITIDTSENQIIISVDTSISGAPTWTDPDQISADVGGLVGGDIVPIGDNSIEILEDILYEYFPPNIDLNLDPSSGYYEKWNPFILSDVSMYGSFNNDAFVKVRITDVSVYATLLGGFGHTTYPDVSSGGFSFNDGGFNNNWDDIVYTAEIYHNYSTMSPTEASAAINFVPPYIFGVAPNEYTIGSSDASLSALLTGFYNSNQKIIVPEQTNEVDFDTTGIFKAKFVYAYPASYGDLTSIFDVKNDFNVTTSFDSKDLNFQYQSSPAISYKIYIKNHWINVSTFKLIFNI